MTGEPDLVSLLYRADWTRLSLSAEVSDGSMLLIGPGRRYRHQSAGDVTGCDGDRPWAQDLDDAEGDDGGGDEDGDGAGGGHGEVHWISGPEPPLRELTCPAWLLRSSRLEPLERRTVCGRDGIQISVTWRCDPGHATGSAGLEAGAAEAVVDAQLGILLSLTRLADGEEPELTEFVSLELDPVIDPAEFAPPPGSLRGESLSEALSGDHVTWRAWKTAAGLAAGGLGAWIRYSPFSHGQTAAADPGDPGDPEDPEDPEDTEAEIPLDEPAPELAPGGWPSGAPVSDEILNLLHRGGDAVEFAATLHEWHDVGALLARVPPAARGAGFGGLGLLIDSITERASVVHEVSTVRVAGPDRYQIDHARQRRRGPKTIACDGERLWKVYPDKVTTGPAEPPLWYLAGLADPSWLLTCRLSGGEPVTVAGRPAYRLSVARGDSEWFEWSPSMIFPIAVAVVDAELGLLLRLTSYLGGRPVWRSELREISTQLGGFQVNIPADLPTAEELGLFDRAREGTPPRPVNIPLKIAGAVARHTATEAANAARNLLRRIGAR